jgi:hypothetical protein
LPAQVFDEAFQLVSRQIAGCNTASLFQQSQADAVSDRSRSSRHESHTIPQGQGGPLWFLGSQDSVTLHGYDSGLDPVEGGVVFQRGQDLLPQIVAIGELIDEQRGRFGPSRAIRYPGLLIRRALLRLLIR